MYKYPLDFQIASEDLWFSNDGPEGFANNELAWNFNLNLNLLRRSHNNIILTLCATNVCVKGNGKRSVLKVQI